MNAWLVFFAELLDLVREHNGREPTDDDRRRAFAVATDLEEANE